MADRTDDGGPAFPVDELDGDGSLYQQHLGLSLRDYFAAKAMQGLMGRVWETEGRTDAQIISMWAASAFAIADAMLKARATPGAPDGN